MKKLIARFVMQGLVRVHPFAQAIPNGVVWMLDWIDKKFAVTDQEFIKKRERETLIVKTEEERQIEIAKFTQEGLILELLEVLHGERIPETLSKKLRPWLETKAKEVGIEGIRFVEIEEKGKM